MPTPYSNRIVAFIDILGFGSLVKMLSSDTDLRKKIHRALSEIRDFKNYSLSNATAQRELEVSVFSDCIAISGEPGGLMTIVSSAMALQWKLLYLGILTRGGISSGKTFHADDILYGEGMMKAHELESKAAVYPRIVIDPDLVGETEAGLCAMFLKRDTDGLWFIDPFAQGGLPDGSENLLEDGWDPNAVFLEHVGRIIEQRLNTLTDAGHRAKWSWIQTLHAAAQKELSTLGKPRFWHILELAKKKGLIPKSTKMKLDLSPAKKISHEWVD